MTDSDYKRYTAQAKAGIKGEAFFEALMSDYSLPHHIVGPRDLGIDYICEWVHGERPTGVLFAVQIKTLCGQKTAPEYLGRDKRLNGLERYSIKNQHLQIDRRTLAYWRGLGMPVYLFVIVYSESQGQGGQLDCFYKRFTRVLTTTRAQEEEEFYKVSKGTTFLAFSEARKQGFTRDLFIDLMRCSYYKGSISYLSPRTIGLEQFPEQDAVFRDVVQEYRETVCRTYAKTKGFLERLCVNHQAEPSPPADG